MTLQISLVTMEMRDSGNLGALARLASNFQLEQLIAINPQCEVDDRAYQRATHGRYYLDNLLLFPSLAALAEHVDIIIALTGRIGNRAKLLRIPIPIYDLSVALGKFGEGRVGVLLGRESYGLTNVELEQCDIVATIPTFSKNNIFNISHAAALALYELHRIELQSTDLVKDLRPASRAEQRQLYKYAEEIIHKVLDERHHESSSLLFQTIFGRALVTKTEINGLLGIFHAIQRKLDENES